MTPEYPRRSFEDMRFAKTFALGLHNPYHVVSNTHFRTGRRAWSMAPFLYPTPVVQGFKEKIDALSVQGNA